jgi:D,D-heptose 1,7-bisphosphate phosphatase
MAERAVFLDRDNTIIDNDGYLGDPSKVKLLTGAATALAALRSLGYRLVVVSNQSGVARGMFGEADVEAVNQEMCKQLREQAGAHIDASYYCPYHPEAVLPEYRMDHDWRKPKPGMLKQAAADFGLDLSQCWMVGDMSRDIASGAAAGCRTILIKDPGHPAPEEGGGGSGVDVSPNFIVKTLADAARIIAREGMSPRRDPVPVVLESARRETGNAKPDEAAAGVAETTATTTVDESALAARVAERLGRSMASTQTTATNPKLEKALEELVLQLRHQNRQADMAEFPLSHLAAIAVQAVAVLCLLAGMFTAIRAPVSLEGVNWNVAVTALLRAVTWLLAAVMLQGGVIALLLHSRQK